MTQSPLQRHINAFVRTGYRLAYLVLRAWWFLRRPQTHGAAVALWHEGKILMVRTSYRACLSLPGGFVRAGEPSEQAARRELHEELGISIPQQELRHAWHGMIRFESRRDVIDIWEASVTPAPTPHVAGREIVWAAWLTPAEGMTHVLLPHVAAYLKEVASPSESPFSKPRFRTGRSEDPS
jgi:8-oxo-dGTP pyrophosphatase MutT (NUDIX family)